MVWFFNLLRTGEDMARMHARRRGKASSHRPDVTAQPRWVPLSREEIEEKVLSLAKEGYSSSMIGMIMRDQYGVPSIRLATGKKLTRLLSEKGVKRALPDDLMSLIKRAVRISRSMGKKDLHARYRLRLVESKIHRLILYYKSRGILPEDWKYSLEESAQLVE